MNNLWRHLGRSILVLLFCALLCISSGEVTVSVPSESASSDRGALTVAVEGRLVIPDPSRRVSHQILSLNGDEFFAIKVSAEEALVSAVEYKYPGAKRQPAAYPIVLTALAPLRFEVQKPPFSPLRMLMANPMMLVMVFMLVVVLVMPKLLQGMTPEELQELQKQSHSGAAAGDPMKNLQKLMGMGGGTAADEDDDQ
eukprot:gene26919-35616_t